MGGFHAPGVFPSHPDAELGEATRQGRLDEFARMGRDPDLVPDPQAELALMRRDRAEPTDPRFTRTAVAFDDDERWLMVDRSGLRIAVNLADVTRTIELGGRPGPMLLATQPRVGVDRETLTLPAHTAVVLAPEGE